LRVSLSVLALTVLLALFLLRARHPVGPNRSTSPRGQSSAGDDGSRPGGQHNRRTNDGGAGRCVVTLVEASSSEAVDWPTGREPPEAVEQIIRAIEARVNTARSEIERMGCPRTREGPG
jgi:hypothetical protein